jgi:hypothetical protein
MFLEVLAERADCAFLFAYCVFDLFIMPKYLYHYTSIQALKSTVEDRYVWASAACSL